MAAAALPSRSASPGADALLRRLEWTVLRRLDGILQGPWRSAARGAGMDLTDLREYQSHDDVRHIDWNVTARTGTPHVRQFVEDRDATAWFLVDVSPSLRVAVGANDKSDVIVPWVGSLARVLTRQGNRVGLMLFDGTTVTRLPPAATRAQVVRMVSMLLRALHGPGVRSAQAAAKATAAPEPAARRSGSAREVGPAPSQDAGDEGTPLAGWLHGAATLIGPRSMVFVLSDFLAPDGWQRPLGHLAMRHDVLAVRVIDPMEGDLPDVGWIHATDAESGQTLLVDTGDPAVRAELAALTQAQDERIASALCRAGVDTFEAATDEDVLPALLRLADLRRLRQRRRPLAAAMRLVPEAMA